MTDLSPFFTPRTVVLDFSARKKGDVLRKVSQMLAGPGTGKADSLEDALQRREILCSTCLGEGVAAPHVLLPGLEKTSLAFLRLRDPVDWRSPDGVPVRLVFALAGPAEDPAAHLQILSRLTQLLREPDFRETVAAAASGEEVASAFRRTEEE